MTTGQKMGEDIRAAKDIFEFYHGPIVETNVNLWMKEAWELQKGSRGMTLSQIADLLVPVRKKYFV